MAEAIIKNDPEYLAWVQELSERYRCSQIKAAVSVNREMLLFYWRLGKDIAELHAESRWGSGFFGTLSRDLRKEIPDAKGFSPRNLRYMKHFYELQHEAANSLSTIRFRPNNQHLPAHNEIGYRLRFSWSGVLLPTCFEVE